MTAARARLGRHHDPIVAIATAPGRGAVGIVRASGRDLAPLIEAICGQPLPPRHARYGAFRDARGESIDQGLALHFPAPHSYTGEDVLELQAHGGPVGLQLLLARCLEAGQGIGLRLAEPGEFTERAFLNDKMDLAQAEAVADLIEAGTEAAARSAARSLSGVFSARVQALAAGIVELRMLVEATLDFPEEEIDFLEKACAAERLQALAAAVDALLAGARHGALLREGLSVVLAGQPNVGKSSLLNALAGAELAIVTPIPGTTRDRVRETIQIEGVPLHVVDTAGLRAAEAASDEVERIGIRRSWESIAEADVVLLLHDLTRRGDPEQRAADAAIDARLPPGVPRLHVFTKADLVPPGLVAEIMARATPPQPAPRGPVVTQPGQSPNQSPGPSPGHAPALALSAVTGEGLDGLRRELLALAGWQAMPEGVFIARSRHVQALQRTQAHLRAALDRAAERDAALDLLAEELRLAHRALGEITGEFSADDLLGVIFSSFCIGK